MKTTKQQGAKAPVQETARLSVRVSVEAYQRLFVASVMGKATASELLDRLILEHCREWSMPAKLSGRVTKHDRVNLASQVSENDAPPALQDAA